MAAEILCMSKTTVTQLEERLRVKLLDRSTHQARSSSWPTARRITSVCRARWHKMGGYSLTTESFAKDLVTNLYSNQSKEV